VVSRVAADKITNRYRHTPIHRLPIISLLLIIGVLGAAACRGYKPEQEPSGLTAREDALRGTLFQFRKVIDIYAADKGELPQSLDDLVRAGYMREIPDDPITQKKDWKIVLDVDPNSSTGRQGVVDVQSASTQHSEW